MFFQDYFGYLMSFALNNFIHILESACFISTRGKEGGREGEREARRGRVLAGNLIGILTRLGHPINKL